MVRAMIISPLIITAFVLAGVFMGFYLSDLTGLSKGMLAIILATGGLFVSLPIVIRLVIRMAADEAKESGAVRATG